MKACCGCGGMRRQVIQCFLAIRVNIIQKLWQKRGIRSVLALMLQQVKILDGKDIKMTPKAAKRFLKKNAFTIARQKLWGFKNNSIFRKTAEAKTVLGQKLTVKEILFKKF